MTALRSSDMTAPLEAPPTVRKPRRQDAALAGWRRAKAVELARAGHSYDSIAEVCGFANRGTAWRTVQKALSSQVVAGVDELRELELVRLDQLLRAHWGKAMVGNLTSAKVVLRVIEQRSRLLGLEYVHKGAASSGPVSIICSTV